MRRKIIVLFLFALILLLCFCLYLAFNSNLVKSKEYINEDTNTFFLDENLKNNLIEFNQNQLIDVIVNCNNCGILQAKEKRQELFRKKPVT